ncbi:hypothetical protein CANCADRAFT_55386 [Tortispora caseinolytica NRRL Y-17796]|uniref:tRNA-splicing endonuclease subunit Sen34 n=1 Tax=Tortispora caseinolytica NRRL Y-17796 TaxID=767744 RepID=A0A1E4TIE8_9ASCO|nr:hypothetical protein CANCADRAFT_55386 [Tortispora caseinolytica NRRL Y-17796]
MIPIQAIGSSFFIFNVDDLKYLRENHKILGTLTGTLPAFPQQSVFLGLPLQLMPEQAKYLVDHEIAYIASAEKSHQQLKRDRELKAKILKAFESKTEDLQRSRKQAYVRRAVANAALHGRELDPEQVGHSFDKQPVPTTTLLETPGLHKVRADDSVFDNISLNVEKLYAYLHDRSYYITPGLRFGGRYLAYPGDSLRFHSHLIVNEIGVDEPIDLLDIVSGGRLGTVVKKVWVLGGYEEAEDAMSVFSIEWAGF